MQLQNVLVVRLKVLKENMSALFTCIHMVLQNIGKYTLFSTRESNGKVEILDCVAVERLK